MTAARVHLIDVRPADELVIRHDGELIKAFACGEAQYVWGERSDRRTWELTVRIDACATLTLVQADQESRYGMAFSGPEVYRWRDIGALREQEEVLDLSVNHR
jgi:hypothetical protein